MCTERIFTNAEIDNFYKIAYNVIRKRKTDFAEDIPEKLAKGYQFIPSQMHIPFAISMGIGTKFIDAGCGIGNIVWLATMLGFDATGIEWNKNYINESRSFFGPIIENKIIHGDILLFNFSEFDTIYSYCPLSNTEAYLKFAKNVLKTMKVGARWIEVYPIKNIQNLKNFKIGRIGFGEDPHKPRVLEKIDNTRFLRIK